MNEDVSKGIVHDLKSILSTLGMSDAEQEKVTAGINQTIMINFAKNVIDKLPEKTKASFADTSTAVEYAKSHLSAKEIQECLADATNKVLSDFLARIDNKIAS